MYSVYTAVLTFYTLLLIEIRPADWGDAEGGLLVSSRKHCAFLDGDLSITIADRSIVPG